MKKLVLCLALILTMTTGYSVAATRGTPEQAKAMVEEAVAFYNANGQEKAFAEFGNPQGKFIKGDLYIFGLDLTGMTLAHGANPKLVGKSLYEVKDADGKLFMQEMIEVAKTKGKGWVEYKWSNPESKKIEPKASYIIRVKDIFLGCGAYK